MTRAVVGTLAAQSGHMPTLAPMLLEQQSASPCVAGKTFGGHGGEPRRMWIRRGCRGVFRCAGVDVTCGCGGLTGVRNCSCVRAAPLRVEHDSLGRWRDPRMRRLRVGPPMANGCEAVYIDGGSNLGLQLDALYAQPSTRPKVRGKNSVAAAMASAFGDLPRERVCAFAFEPNPRHAAHLERRVAEYRRRGLRAYFLPAALAASDGVLQFHADTRPSAPMADYGASALSYVRATAPATEVSAVGLSGFLTRHVLRATAAAGKPRAKVVAKCDIEGAEYDVLLPAARAICNSVDVLALERHDRFYCPAWLPSRDPRDVPQEGGRLYALTRMQRWVGSAAANGTCRTQLREMSRWEAEAG